jgi:hypothetical protein
VAHQLVSGTLACYAIRQSINHRFKCINFLLIRDISATITSLNNVTVLLATYLSICPVWQVTDFWHDLPMQPGSKRVKEMVYEDMAWNHQGWGWGLLVASYEPLGFIKVGNFFTSFAVISFWRKYLLQGVRQPSLYTFQEFLGFFWPGNSYT